MALPVHIIPQGLPADQTHAMILLSLQNLQCAAESVFERLEESFSREKGTLLIDMRLSDALPTYRHARSFCCVQSFCTDWQLDCLRWSRSLTGYRWLNRLP